MTKKKEISKRPETESPRERNYYWGMNDEIRYLKEIGTSDVGKTYGKTRREWLMGYLKTMKVRTNWGPLDKEKLELYIVTELGYCHVCHRKLEGGSK